MCLSSSAHDCVGLVTAVLLSLKITHTEAVIIIFNLCLCFIALLLMQNVIHDKGGWT